MRACCPSAAAVAAAAGFVWWRRRRGQRPTVAVEPQTKPGGAAQWDSLVVAGGPGGHGGAASTPAMFYAGSPAATPTADSLSAGSGAGSTPYSSRGLAAGAGGVGMAGSDAAGSPPGGSTLQPMPLPPGYTRRVPCGATACRHASGLTTCLTHTSGRGALAAAEPAAVAPLPACSAAAPWPRCRRPQARPKGRAWNPVPPQHRSKQTRCWRTFKLRCGSGGERGRCKFAAGSAGSSCTCANLLKG